MTNPPPGAPGNANDEAARTAAENAARHDADEAARIAAAIAASVDNNAAAMSDNDPQNPFIKVQRKRFISPSQRQRAGFRSAAEYLSADINDSAVREVLQLSKMKTLVEAVAASTVDTSIASRPTSPVIDAPLDTKTRSTEGYGNDTIYVNRYAISVPFVFCGDKNPKTGLPVMSPRKLVVDLVSKIIHSLHKADEHGVCLPYDDDSTAKEISQARDLPADAGALGKYAKDFRFNRKTGKIIFHLRIQSSISLQQLKDKNSPFKSAIKKDFRRFIEERGYWIMTQSCAATRLLRQGFLQNSHSSDNISRLKDQITNYWLEQDVAFNPEMWQLSPRSTKTKQPGTKGTYVEHTAVWLDCDATIVQTFRDACRLLIRKSITSEYPLLWNLTFIPGSRISDLGDDTLFRAAKIQRDFNRDRFTFPVEGWSPLIDPHQDAPQIDYGTAEEPDVQAHRSLATLIVIQATAALASGEVVQLLSKVQIPENKTGVWNFQGWKDTADEARNWIDNMMMAKLAEWTSHVDNSKEGHFTLQDLGAPVRTYMVAGNKGRNAPGDDARGQGTHMETYTRAVNAAAGINTPSGPHPVEKTGTKAFTPGGTKRQKNRGVVTAASYSAMVQQPIPEAFPPMPYRRESALPAVTIESTNMTEATAVSSLSQSVETMQQSYQAFRDEQEAARQEQQCVYDLERKQMAQDREELRLTMESIRKEQERGSEATEVEQDNRREELRTSVEQKVREQIRSQFEKATADWQSDLNAALVAATATSTAEIISLVKKQREEDQVTIAAEFSKLSTQIANMSRIISQLTPKGAAGLALPAEDFKDDDVEFTEGISAAKRIKNADGLPIAPNIPVIPT